MKTGLCRCKKEEKFEIIIIKKAMNILLEARKFI